MAGSNPSSRSVIVPEDYHIHGKKRYLSTLGLGLVLCISTLDSTIGLVYFHSFSQLYGSNHFTVGVALPTIGATFDDYRQTSWIVTAYLVTYTAFLPVVSKLTDILGRKPVLVFSTLFFMVQSLVPQMYTPTSSLFLDMVRSMWWRKDLAPTNRFSRHSRNRRFCYILLRSRHPHYNGPYRKSTFSLSRHSTLLHPQDEIQNYTPVIGIVFALSSVAGPLMGGAIVSHIHWGKYMYPLCSSFWFPSRNSCNRLDLLRQSPGWRIGCCPPDIWLERSFARTYYI